MSRLQEKPSSLKRALQKMKFINFFYLLDPDCESGSGYGSRDTIESGSTAPPSRQYKYLVQLRMFEVA
jgi:hypothetical protein